MSANDDQMQQEKSDANCSRAIGPVWYVCHPDGAELGLNMPGFATEAEAIAKCEEWNRDIGGHFVIGLPEAPLEDDDDPSPLIPDGHVKMTAKPAKWPTPGGTIQATAGSQLPQGDRPCGECNGDGTVYTKAGEELICGQCDGTGVEPEGGPNEQVRDIGGDALTKPQPVSENE